MSMVVIVNYGMGNLDSVARAIEVCGGRPFVTDRPHDLRLASRIILPGVGAFPEAMRRLRAHSFDQELHEQVIEKRIPFLGICLGMHLMASKGWEVEEAEGLGWMPGEVRRLQPAGEDTRVPHVGWNEVNFQAACPLFKGITPGRDFYFVHSYVVHPADASCIVGQTPYGTGFVSAWQRNLIFGVQFHPEKSQRVGLQVLKNFLEV